VWVGQTETSLHSSDSTASLAAKGAKGLDSGRIVAAWRCQGVSIDLGARHFSQSYVGHGRLSAIG